LRVLNILINSEIWHEIVDIVALAWLDVVPLVLEVFLGPVKTLVGVSDARDGLVSTKVRDKIVHGVAILRLNL
jgi:hypothetical protein